MSRLHTLFFALAAGSIFLCGCDRTDPEPTRNPDGPFIVLTTFYPTLYFAQRLAGERVEVLCPVPEDADPIFWMPDEATIERYQKADLILLNGAGFEKWVKKVSLPPRNVVDTAAALSAEFIHYEDAVVHVHGPSGKHDHSGLDGHTWLDPILARSQAQAILHTLQKRLPEHAQALEENYRNLVADLDALDHKLRSLADRYPAVPMFCSHPAFNYIGRRYGWPLRNLDLDPHTPPSAKVIAEIRALQQQHPARLLLWESQPTPEVETILRTQLGLHSCTFSPCELLPPSPTEPDENYMSLMHRNLKNLEKGYQSVTH